MSCKITNKDNYYLKLISFAYGFFLIWGLSSEGMWANIGITVIPIVLSAFQTLWLKKIKGIGKIYWLYSYWLLLISAIAYSISDSILLKASMFCVMHIAVYLNLYRICYYEELTKEKVYGIIKDVPILCFSYMTDFFAKSEYLDIRLPQEKRKIGITILLAVLICIIFPLYIIFDYRLGILLELVADELFSYLPIWAVCAFLAIIPAFINYSIMRGLIEDVILNNPQRGFRFAQVTIPSNDIFLNSTVVKIVLGGLSIVTIILIGLQVDYMYRLLLYKENLETLDDMRRIYPILVAIGIGIFVIAISQYIILSNHELDKMKRVLFVYEIVQFCLLLLISLRHVIKFVYYGIAKADIISIGICIMLGSILIVFIQSIIMGSSIVSKLAIWMVIVFIVFSLFPYEYVVSQVNVTVFLHKYQKGQVEEPVRKEDIDLVYLDEMGYQAIPALISLMDISVSYENNRQVCDIAKGTITNMFFQDMTEDEINSVGNLETQEEIENFMMIMSQKMEYRIFGKRKIAFKLFYEKIIA